MFIYFYNRHRRSLFFTNAGIWVMPYGCRRHGPLTDPLSQNQSITLFVLFYYKTYAYVAYLCTQIIFNYDVKSHNIALNIVIGKLPFDLAFIICILNNYLILTLLNRDELTHFVERIQNNILKKLVLRVQSWPLYNKKKIIFSLYLGFYLNFSIHPKIEKRNKNYTNDKVKPSCIIQYN